MVPPIKNPEYAYTPMRVTSWRGSFPRHYARATHLLSKKCRSVGNTMSNLTGPRFDSLTFRFRDKRVTARPTRKDVMNLQQKCLHTYSTPQIKIITNPIFGLSLSSRLTTGFYRQCTKYDYGLGQLRRQGFLTGNIFSPKLI